MAANVSTVLHVRCHYCSKFKPASDVRSIGEFVQICSNCYEAHNRRIEALAEPPSECPGCQRAIADIQAAELGDKFSMFLHLRDGQYQLLCRRCDAEYIPKRKDLYGHGPFGRENKLI